MITQSLLTFIFPANTRSINIRRRSTECLQDHLRACTRVDRMQRQVPDWSLDRCHAYLLDSGHISLLLYLLGYPSLSSFHTKTSFPAGASKNCPHLSTEWIAYPLGSRHTQIKNHRLIVHGHWNKLV